MTSKTTHTKDFFAGAVIGSLLGGVTALLTAPKAGKRLRQEMNDFYSDVSDQSHDIADNISKKTRSVMKSFGSHSNELADKAKCLYCGVKKMMGCEQEEEEETCTKDLMMGGVIGGVLGAVVGLLLAPKSGSELRDDIVEGCEKVSDKTRGMADQFSKNGKKMAATAYSKTNKWLDLAKGIVHEWTDEAEEKSENFTSQAKHRMDDLMDWAALGYRVWQGINKKR
ncbi:YtxH domain-containing protein [Candidatus Protochlamydia amoebophila]|jgi:gas vesicle protein|uniref:YtxH domain-containing protein n=1 Tax=Candidatus Protochlamydia amoebophila TaxID=362787 RepID=A0A0C1JNS7_9BACT|nr:YtxH domain-containing protein [Candidatus Protochlamydia amoebophila]KIC72895.1 hypothetical protein DB44_BY00180 [Candidatus Protochlamydia amoebophila]